MTNDTEHIDWVSKPKKTHKRITEEVPVKQKEIFNI